MPMKYVIFSSKNGPLPIIFHPLLDHDQVAIKFRDSLGAPFSAGHIGFDVHNNISCFGNSETLCIGMDSDDEIIINAFLGKKKL